MFRIIVIFTLCAVWSWIGSVVAAEEPSDYGTVAELPEPSQEPAEGKRGPVRSLVQGATPEEQEQLSEERKRISATAAASGTDPTAIIGYFQLGYGHNAYTNNLNLNAATAVIRLPITPNFLFQVTLPYLWTELSGPRGFTTNGISDTTVRVGGRLYSSENVALFIGGDASFPTASEDQLGTGKYALGPAAALAVPLPRTRSLFFLLVQDFNSVGGDSSRADIHYMRVQAAVNTFWSEHWWSSVLGTWDIDDRNNDRKTTMDLLGEVGHNFDKHWNVFAGYGAGLTGRDTPLGLDWTVQAGVRWVFSASVFSKALFGGFSGD